MSVETVKIRPELDAAALRKAEADFEKAFSPSGRALGGLRKAVAGFARDLGAVGRNLDLAQGAASAKREFEAAKRQVRDMRAALTEATETLGQDHKLVRQMRAEMVRVEANFLRVAAIRGRMADLAERTAQADRASAQAAKAQAERQKRLAKEASDYADKYEKARERYRKAQAERSSLLYGPSLQDRIEAAKASIKERGGLAGMAVGGLRAGVGGVERAAVRGATGAAVLGAGITAGAVAAASRIRSEMDRAAKSANLTVEEFSRLKHAAELSGTSVEQVEKAASVLQRQISKGKLDESFAGGLRALGVDAKALGGKSAEQQLALLADAMQGVGDAGQRTVIASRLFGDEIGAKLVPMLENGGAALRAAGDEAEALGLVFSADAAAAAERLGDAQDKLAKAVRGTLTEAFASVVPLLAETAGRMVEWAKANREAVSEKVQAALRKVVETLQALWARAQEVDWGAWTKRASALAEVLFTVAKALSSLLDKLGPMGGAFALLGVKIGLALGPLGALAVAAAGVGAAFGAMAADAASAIDSTLVKVRAAQAEALKIAQEQEIEGLREGIDDPYKISQANKKAAEEVLKNELYLRGAKSIRDLPADVRRKIERISLSGKRDIGRAEVARLSAEANKKRAKEIARDLETKKPGKPEEGAAAAQVRKDIETLAERYGQREYQRVLQGGGSLAEAKVAELKARRRAKEDLTARGETLARRGFVGGSGGPTFVGGVSTGAGGAIPVSLDLGGHGGPPPVQIVQILAGAQVEIPITAAATSTEVDAAIRSGVRKVLSDAIAEALPLVDSGIRR